MGGGTAVPFDPVSLPVTSSDAVLRLLSVFLLIAINAFFVTAEFAIVSVRRSRINQLADAGDVQAKTVQDLQQSIDRLLSTTQFGITLSSLALGWIGEGAMVVLVAGWLQHLPMVLPNRAIAHTIAVPLTFCLLAYLQSNWHGYWAHRVWRSPVSFILSSGY